MQTRYLHLRLPKRGPYYFAFGVGLIFAFWLGKLDAPFLTMLPLGGFLAAIFWFAFRDTPSGMEISGGEWRFFVGRQSWVVPLGDISSVRLRRDAAPALTFRNGRVQNLPRDLQPDPIRLRQELVGRGISVEG